MMRTFITDRIFLVGPRSEFYLALLLIEGKILDVDVASGFKDARREPAHGAGVFDYHVRL